jgi:type II secretory pathway predicted ATPase ExeA
MTNAENILRDLELEYLSKLETRMEERVNLTPLTEKKTIYSLLWNLKSDKWSARLSYNLYCEILDILFSRLNQEDKDNH